MDTAQKVAVITGASRGIGEGLVTAYRGLGYGVVATARSIRPSSDPDVLAVPADIARPGAGARLADAAMERFGRIDTLVNNAGIFVSKPFTEYTDEDFDTVTGVNLRGFFEVSRSAIGAMLSGDGGGHVVNVSTTLVENADAEVTGALATLTKGGLNAVTRSLAIEYATRGIRVNAVSLGVIRTPMHPTDPDGFQAARHPVRRMGEVEDVVRAILYLEQAPFVTGEISHVDGGQSAGH
ncbi:MAG: SDR family oxidoreductase [Actinomycetia bacterium]|nr:SDR family oxidoreductase [Actinomycetes bacterium]MCL2728721.1 SDR family oxidoreductase [Actinomycetes bacterium]